MSVGSCSWSHVQRVIGEITSTRGPHHHPSLTVSYTQRDTWEAQAPPASTARGRAGDGLCRLVGPLPPPDTHICHADALATCLTPTAATTQTEGDKAEAPARPVPK
eukprot:3685994-Prymnesium_polylepis.1